MLLRLILMRHAKSSWKKPVSDHDRDLNKRGYLSAATMGNWLRKNDFIPDESLISTSKRTKETFKELKIKSKKVQFLSNLYHPNLQEMLDALKSAQEKTVLIISHNTACAEFAEKLAKVPPNHEQFYDFPTCATWVADFNIDSWRDVQFGTAKTVAFVIPREVICADELKYPNP